MMGQDSEDQGVKHKAHRSWGQAHKTTTSEPKESAQGPVKSSPTGLQAFEFLQTNTEE